MSVTIPGKILFKHSLQIFVNLIVTLDAHLVVLIGPLDMFKPGGKHAEDTGPLKGQCHEIFLHPFFSLNSSFWSH